MSTKVTFTQGSCSASIETSNIFSPLSLLEDARRSVLGSSWIPLSAFDRKNDEAPKTPIPPLVA